jgi:hypothetical protein
LSLSPGPSSKSKTLSRGRQACFRVFTAPCSPLVAPCRASPPRPAAR